MKFTLKKEERLKSKKLIGKLFSEGVSIKKFPLKMIYLQTSHTSKYPVQVGFVTPKKIFKKAVQRNRIKRLLREVFRKEKYLVYNNIEQPYVFMITFIGKEEPEYLFLEKKMQRLLSMFLEKIKE